MTLRPIRRIAVMLVCLGLLIAASPGGRPQERPPDDEVKKLLGASPRPSTESPLPVLTKGYPTSVRLFAEKYAAQRGRLLRDKDAVEFAFDALRASASATGSKEGVLAKAPPEAIVIASALLRPALLVCNDQLNEPVPESWYDELNKNRGNLARTSASVGLISCENVPDYREIGTGFVVARNKGSGVVMTNRHVAETFATQDGQFKKHPVNRRPASASIDFVSDYCGNVSRTFKVNKVIHVEPEPGPDVALLELEDPANGLPEPLPLATEAPAKELVGRGVYTTGYPFEDWRNPATAQREVFGTVFGVKRQAPGRLKPVEKGSEDGVIFHDCSTLGGNSGSPVVDLVTNTVIGIHFAGLYEKTNYAWTMWRVLRIPKVAEIVGKKPVEGQPKGDPPAVKPALGLAVQSQRTGLPDPNHQELFTMLGQKLKSPSEAPVPLLTAGVPDPVRLAAEHVAAGKSGKELRGQQAADYVFGLDREGYRCVVAENPLPLPESLRRPSNSDNGVGGTKITNPGSISEGLPGPPRPTYRSQWQDHGRFQLLVVVKDRELGFGDDQIDSRDVTRAYLRPALTIRADGIVDPVPTPWLGALNKVRAAIERVNQSVACIQTFDTSGVVVQGTGFVVAPNLIMTNRHVALQIANPAPAGGWEFKMTGGEPAGVHIDFAKEMPFVNPVRFQVTKIAYVHPEPGPDIAILEVAGMNGRVPLRFPPPLAKEVANPLLNFGKVSLIMTDRPVYVVGHPSSQARFQEWERVQLGRVLDIKKLSPGLLTGISDRMYYHDCSTTGGHSGSPVIDLVSGEVLGVHFCGEYKVRDPNRKPCLDGDNTLDRNYAIPTDVVMAIPEVRRLLRLP